MENQIRAVGIVTYNSYGSNLPVVVPVSPPETSPERRKSIFNIKGIRLLEGVSTAGPLVDATLDLPVLDVIVPSYEKHMLSEKVSIPKSS